MKEKRKYIRKCGICGEQNDQSDMIRTKESPNDWMCCDCYDEEHPDYTTEDDNDIY